MMSTATRTCRLLAAGLLLLTAASVSAKNKDKQADPGEPPRPRLTLNVTPRHGFRPVTFTLTASLEGVSDNDEQYCHPGLEWEWISPYGTPMTSKEDPRCLHPPEQVHVNRTFTKIVTLNSPGTYSYRVTLYRRDGERIISNSAQVEVLDTH
jgi:hypothetical protein